MSTIRDYIKALILGFSNEKTKISVNGVPLTTEIMSNPDQRRAGLMFRKKLPENCGALFVFFDEKPRSFFMKNTAIPLSIAYISSDGTINSIQDLEPLNTGGVSSRVPCKFALEVNRGWFEENGIKPGHKIKRVTK